jgi:hyperosmotically inducible periplasmic protein
MHHPGGVSMMRKRILGFSGVVAVATAMTVACSASDAGITSAVKSRLAADDTVKAYRIDVDTKDKVVTLRGEVETATAKNRAVELARATNGVRDVVDVLALAPATAPTSGVADRAPDAARDEPLTGDPGITVAVKTKMLADTTVSGLKIDVDTKDGVVVLAGNVASAAEKRRAIEIARETDGVKSVKDQLKIVKP